MRWLAVFFGLILGGQLTSAEPVTFGTDANQFSMDFVTIGNPGNAAPNRDAGKSTAEPEC